jgi:RNA polymerase sigma-70 factor, ECF subfamily
MSGALLERAARASGGRVIAALAARFRDLDLAEEAFADACLRAAEAWTGEADMPRDPAAWLYRVAQRSALDRLRRQRTRASFEPDPQEPAPTAEDVMVDDGRLIPDERLRLIFVCCHPAVAIDARAALTLRLVCGLSTAEIARAFLLQESTLAQRLVRAKRKIAEAGIGFEVPGREAWPERLDAVLSTLEVAYAKAHEDAAGAGQHAGYAEEMLSLTRTLADMLPHEPEALALAATVRFAEARRPGRLDDGGAMVPLSEQDPASWRRPLIEEGQDFLRRAGAAGEAGPRTVQAAIHAAWCSRRSLDQPAPWRRVLALYDLLLVLRDDAIVRLNRAVAVAEVLGAEAAASELEGLEAEMQGFLPYHAVQADIARRLGRFSEARAAYDAALTLGPGPAERLWLMRRRDSLAKPPNP